MTRTAPAPVKTSWLPMVSLFLAQVLMSFNVAALPISLGGMVADFGVPPTIASTTIVMYGLAVAALVMTGAKLGQRVGWVLIFRVVVALFAGSAVMMLLAPTVWWAIAGQAVAGAAAAIIVPSIVALIAENYRGPQQATAIGAIGSARAISGVSAFLIGGTLGTLVGWRPLFVIVLAIAVAVFALSFTLRGDRGDAAIRIDLVAALLIGAAIVLLTLGFNNLNSWEHSRRRRPRRSPSSDSRPPRSSSSWASSWARVLPVDPAADGRGKVPLIDLTVLGSSRSAPRCTPCSSSSPSRPA